MIAGFVLSFYAIITGALGYRKEKPKNNKWVWIGLFSGLVFLTTLSTFLFLGLLSGWAGLISIFI
jgi:Mn2+/Fe2+ NRAMP family transporter